MKISKKSKLAVITISSLLCLAVIITAIGFSNTWRDQPTHTPNINVVDPTDDEAAIDVTDTNNADMNNADLDNNQESDDEQEAHGGFDGEYAYSYAYDYRLYALDTYLIEYVKENIDPDFGEWLNMLDEEGNGIDYFIGNPDYIPWLIRVIEEFDIPKEAFEEINNTLFKINDKNGWPQDDTFTQDEIDAIYSKDAATITKIFASDYAIIVGDKACAPEWYLNASQEEIKKYGISTSEINAKTEILIENSIIKSNEIE